MAKVLLSLPEVLALLDAIKLPSLTVERFRQVAEAAYGKKIRLSDAQDQFEVSSGFGHHTKKGFVNFRTGDIEHQMTPDKAREIARMLAEVAEAATTDEVFARLLEELGVETASVGQVLLRLRELRQGTRDVQQYPPIQRKTH